MRTLLAALGDPQLAYPAIHVVGTNGKSTATLTIEALLRAEGLSVGSTISPHIRSWAERIRVDGAPADFEAAVGARPARGRGAGGDPVRDGLRGGVRRVRGARASTSRSSRRASAAGSTRPTCSARTSSCSRTSGSSTRTCWARRASRSPPRSSRSCRRERSPCCPTRSSRASPARTSSSAAPARQRRRSSAGRLEREVEVSLPGRLERRGEEVWDGAHNPDGARLARPAARRLRLHPRASRSCATRTRPRCWPSSPRSGDTLVATESSNPRSLPAEELARLAEPHFARGRDRARSRHGARPRARAWAGARDRIPLSRRRPLKERRLT